MKKLLFLAAMAVTFFASCEKEGFHIEPEPEQIRQTPTCTSYTQVDPVYNDAFADGDAVEVAYNEGFASFRSPYPLSGFSLLNTFDCINATESVTYSQEYNYYICEVIFREDFIHCVQEERGPDGFFMTINYDCAVTSRMDTSDFGGWKAFIDSVGSKLDGMEINGQYINIEGTPALGVVKVGDCGEGSMYFDWLPKSGEPSHLRQQNYMRSCTGVFEAEINLNKKELDFTHDTDREIIAQPVVFMSGDVLHISEDFHSTSGRGIQAEFSEDILAAIDSTGYLFFAVGHE